MHIAIENGYVESCKILLEKKVDLFLTNNNKFDAVSYSIYCSKPEILDLILSYNKNFASQGRNPLNLCALTDNFDCAKVLLKHGSLSFETCSNGFFPIHIAASKGSHKVLKLLIEDGFKKGISKDKMFSFIDADNNKPLHSAVQVNNAETVQLCLMHGSKIDETTEISLLTPIHLACAQGSLEILKIMLDAQPKLKDKVINMKDVHEMTPLHKASMFDHVEVVDFLLKNGSDIDAIDQENRSPLLLAASRNCVKVICFLLEKNANFQLRDAKSRNFLHFIVSHADPVETFTPNMHSNEKETLGIEGSLANSQNISTSVHSFHEISKALIKVSK